jgi:hypothetical protein
MSLSDAYPAALARYLQDQYESAPPALATIGVIKVGSYQDDPERKPAIITIHTNDPLNEKSTHIELITDQKAQGGGSGHRLWGGYAEMGDEGKGSFYWYYWWLRAEYYLTRSGMVQERAQELNGDLVEWLRTRLQNASVRALDLAQDETAQLLQTKIASVTTREHGGKPSSYIWSTLFMIRGLVVGD